MTYIKRVIDAELKERLSSAGAVVLEGPKACGKTETAMQIAASSVFLDLDSAARRPGSLTNGNWRQQSGTVFVER